MKESLNSMSTTVGEIDGKTKDSVERLQESNGNLKKKLEHLERYSRDFNIRIIGVDEEEGEDCTGNYSGLLRTSWLRRVFWRTRECSPHW